VFSRDNQGEFSKVLIVNFVKLTAGIYLFIKSADLDLLWRQAPDHG